MKINHAIFAFVTCALAAFAQTPVHWTMLRNGAALVEAGINRQVSHGGKSSATVQVRGGKRQPGSSGLQQTIRASEYLGKRLRISAYLKTLDARDAVLFFRIDGDRRVLEFATTARERLKDKSDWEERALILDVPDNAVLLSYGVLLTAGQVWIDDVRLERVGHEFSPDASRPHRQAKPMRKNAVAALPQPRNLGFEQ